MAPASAPRRSVPLPPAGPQRGSRAWRWIAVLLAVVVVHWIAAQWFERNRVSLNPHDSGHVPVQVALLTPERVENKPAAAQPAPAPTPARKAAASPPREHVLTALQPAKQAAPATVASDVAASAPAAASAPHATGATGTGTASAPVAASAPPAAPGVKFSVPPSAELQYDTFYNGVRNAPGTIHWTSNAKGYEMIVSVPLPFVGPFIYSSRGHLDAFGLAPDQYSEKRGRRAEDIAIFNRTAKTIGFTRTPTTLPLPDGAQDRFSMVMQLASLVRGDPSVYKPGVTRQFFVVDNDSGEIWPVETIGDETIRTDQGYLETRHFKRLPRHDGDQRRIDVWLAPSLGWLPARIVQTEPNGAQFELVWRGKLSIDETGSAGSNANAPAAADAGPAGNSNGTASSMPANSANPPPTTAAPAVTPEPAAPPAAVSPASGAVDPQTPGQSE